MKVELLAPAGDKECLIAAIQNGANAVYLGGTLFNARAFAKNFDKDELKWAVEYAHLREAKIFVTLNTLYKDNELNDLFDYVAYLYEIEVDALIVQDIGLFDYLRANFPDFEVHMSTQASITNSHAARYFESLGAKRIVLARENTLDEIRAICQNTSLDVEVFVHGALCMCYSGQCLMSSMIGKRSGNRGACAQPCRLDYRLKEDNQLLKDDIPYILSPKDLMTIDKIGDLIDAGVYSFKIEGRMKRPEYVASVVSAYRKAIDNHLNHRKEDLTKDIHSMKQMFNRNYTSGYAFNDRYLVDGDYPGNKGIIIGEVVSYDKKKQRVRCLLTETLQQEDSILFESIDKGRPVNKIYLNGKLVSKAYKGDSVEIEFNTPVKNGSVRKIIDKDLIQKLQQTYEKENIRLPVIIDFKGIIGQPARLTMSYKDITITRESIQLCEKAINRPLDQERIIQQLSKLGQTVFKAEQIHVDIDNQMIMPIKALNELRRQVSEELENHISTQKHHTKQAVNNKILNKIKATHHTFEIMVQNIAQLKKAITYPIDRIYYPYQSDSLEAFNYVNKTNIDFVLVLPRICKDQDIQQIINSEIYQKTKTILVNDYGTYYLCNDKERIIGTGLNVYNSYSADHYKEDKLLSLEMSNKQLLQLNTDLNHCIYQVYGKVENMISDYCPISQYYFHKQNKKCNLCKKHSYTLIDRKGAQFDLMMDESCRMHLLHHQTLYLRQIDKLNIKGYFIHFTNENEEMVDSILVNFTTNNHIIPNDIETTTGHFKD